MGLFHCLPWTPFICCFSFWDILHTLLFLNLMFKINATYLICVISIIYKFIIAYYWFPQANHCYSHQVYCHFIS